MKKQIKLGAASVLALLLAANTQAFELTQPVPATLPISSNNQLGASNLKIMLMGIKLTDAEKQHLLSYQPKNSNTSMHRGKALPPSVNLGMNGVPVLNQGYHGTCVTFANTAAVDAIIGKKDYVSQFCQLELGNTLEKSGYWLSGWNGAFGPEVLDQMLRFGIVNTSKTGCATKDYPKNDEYDLGKSFSLTEYKSKSENIDGILYPVFLMNFYERFDSKFPAEEKMPEVLQQVKEALASQNRVTFGTLLYPSRSCPVGACGTYKVEQDTWSSRNVDTNNKEAGHEMVIIGYDDNAVVDGEKGLFILRNSWTDQAGDKGNYYMTYDYFLKYAGEANVIVNIKNS